MKFARVVFWLAGGMGALALIPLYLTPGDPMYYGMLATLVAWQIAFFFIGKEPVRFRPLMIPAFLEKALWMITLAFLYTQGKVPASDLAANAATHGVLGVLFAVAYARTGRIK